MAEILIYTSICEKGNLLRSSVDNRTVLNWDSPSVKVLFQLLRIALGKEEPSSLPNDVNWQEVYDLSLKQGVGAIACDGMLALKECSIDEELRYKWMGQSMVIERKSESQWRLLNQLADMYAQHGICTYILKGISFASYYPEPFHRSSSDVDICLLDDFEKGNILVEETGVKVNRAESKHSHFTIHNIHVENHQYCVGIKGNRQNRVVEHRLRQLLSENSSVLGNSMVLRPEWLFNALFSMCHAQTHFLVEEGITFKHIIDWVVLKKQAISDDILDVFWRDCNSFGLLKFAKALDELADYMYYDGYISEFGKKMLQDILCHREHKKGKNRFLAHLNILQMIKDNAWKYKLFSNTSAMRMISIYIYGYFFDRSPKL